jgi:Tol biopolymer transport system component
MLGRTISHFEILEKLGEGGMGVVWKARDKRLGRLVALKVLPAKLVALESAKRRFVKEAKAASALNHPNIVAIYEIDSAEGLDFVAMELIPGKSLDLLIRRKGLPLNESLKYSIQMADALAAAHAAGIVHRDVKPSNIMVNENGMVKVLDFGLAKLTEDSETSEFASTATIAESPQTDEGTIVGTASYMSPEQAEGKKVDARSDIFSFGVVLYEMLTGRRAFQGDSKMSTLAAILNHEPEPVEQVVKGIPREVSRVLYRCLRKEPQRRAQSMADLKLVLEEVKEESESGTLQAPPATARGGKLRRITLAVLTVLAVVAGAAFWYLRSNHTPVAPLQAVPLTSYSGNESFPSFSPNGKQVAFSWNGQKQDNADIYVKLIGSSGAPLRLTTDPAYDTAPAWSPDGGLIAFVRRRDGRAKVILVPALGGPERELIDMIDSSFASSSVSVDWSPDGRWLVVPEKDSAESATALWLVSIESGERRQLTRPPATTFGDYYGAFSPDGRTLAFVRHTAFWAGDLCVLPLDGNLSAKAEPRRLTNDNMIIQGITWTTDAREVVFSSNRAGISALWRVAISSTGEPQRLSIGEHGFFPSISRQGNRLVYSQSIDDTNIWRVNLLDRRDAPVQLIASTRPEFNPQYSPDGKKIAFASVQSGHIEVWLCDADGSNPVQLTTMGHSGSPRWSPDGQRLAIDSITSGNWQIYIMGAHGGRPRRLTNSTANDMRPSWSHDGRWIYFGSNRSGGTQQIWKVPVSGGEPVQVTTHGGFNPFESKDGKAIYYAKSEEFLSSLWKVPVEGGEEELVLESVFNTAFALTQNGIYFISQPGLSYFRFSTGTSKRLLAIQRGTHIGLTVSPDEKWLLYPQVDQDGSDLVLVENFR